MSVPMMFEDRKGYEIAERMAAEAVGSIDPVVAVARSPLGRV
jgi:hypothetical protein